MQACCTHKYLEKSMNRAKLGDSDKQCIDKWVSNDKQSQVWANIVNKLRVNLLSRGQR